MLNNVSELDSVEGEGVRTVQICYCKLAVGGILKYTDRHFINFTDKGGKWCWQHFRVNLYMFVIWLVVFCCTLEFEGKVTLAF